MPLYYLMDIYYRPEGQTDPVLWKAKRVNAQNDAEAIPEAEASFRSLTENNPAVTGFLLRRVGVRRAGDRLIHKANRTPNDR
jgi:hypothetical protein